MIKTVTYEILKCFEMYKKDDKMAIYNITLSNVLAEEKSRKATLIKQTLCIP